jgi:hypothetical protein
VSLKQMEVSHDFEQFMLKMGPMFKFGMGKGNEANGTPSQTAQEKISAVIEAGDRDGDPPVTGI